TDHAYLPNREILDYLHRYAETFGLTSRIRLGTRVELIRRDGAGLFVGHAGTDERFERVVVASGMFHAPAIPAGPGLETVSGSAGATSTYHFAGRAISQSANTFRLRPGTMSISWPRCRSTMPVANTVERVGLARKNAVSSTPRADTVAARSGCSTNPVP